MKAYAKLYRPFFILLICNFGKRKFILIQELLTFGTYQNLTDEHFQARLDY